MCSDKVDYVSLDLGLCCFVIDDLIEVVMIDLMHQENQSTSYLISIDCPGFEPLLAESFGSVHEILGTFKRMSKAIQVLRMLFIGALLSYKKTMKSRFDSWKPGESLQEKLRLGEADYVRFLTNVY